MIPTVDPDIRDGGEPTGNIAIYVSAVLLALCIALVVLDIITRGPSPCISYRYELASQPSVLVGGTPELGYVPVCDKR